jgi:hypothetical protein
MTALLTGEVGRSGGAGALDGDGCVGRDGVPAFSDSGALLGSLLSARVERSVKRKTRPGLLSLLVEDMGLVLPTLLDLVRVWSGLRVEEPATERENAEDADTLLEFRRDMDRVSTDGVAETATGLRRVIGGCLSFIAGSIASLGEKTGRLVFSPKGRSCRFVPLGAVTLGILVKQRRGSGVKWATGEVLRWTTRASPEARDLLFIVASSLPRPIRGSLACCLCNIHHVHRPVYRVCAPSCQARKLVHFCGA